MENTGKIRLTNLDLLKTIATVLVVFHHYQQVFNVSFDGPNFYGGRFYFGHLVEFFFVISGFITAFSDKEDNVNVVRPILKKLSRIYPTVALSVTFILFVSSISILFFGVDLTGQSYSFVQIISSYLLVFYGWGIDAGFGVNSPTWYLCILILCYLIYYLVKRITAGHYWYRITIYILIVITSLVFRQFYVASGLPFIGLANVRGYASFFIGVLIYDFSRLIRNKKVLIALACTALTLFGLISLKYGLNHWQTLTVLLFPGIVLLSISVKQIPSKSLTTLGGISYEVYLWHLPMMRLCSLIVASLGITFNHSHLSMIIFALIVEGVAFIVYKYFELPVSRALNSKFLPS